MSRRILAALLAVAGVLAGGAQVRWLETTYDFGSFREEAGGQRGRVRLVNEGTEPTVINRVKSTCGCTVADYTHGLIEPGDTAEVTFVYDPTGRPGRFEKHIKVYTGVDNDLTSITLKGTVIGSSSTLAQNYPVEAGPMRLSARKLELGKVVYGRARHEYVSGYNMSADTLQLAWSEPDRPVSLGVSSKSVAPGDLFTLGLYFNTRDEVRQGPVEYRFRLYPQEGGTDEYTEIEVTADIVPDTSGMSEQQLREAASAMAYPALIELGNVKRGEKSRKFSFKLRNEGHTPLEVKRIEAAAPYRIKVKQMPARVAPGKEHEVKAELITADMPEGAFRVEVLVVTSDPLRPTRVVRLVGTKQ